jgi:hypothetical protein
MSQDEQLMQALEDFKRGGWIVAILGGLGALARLILTNEKVEVFVWTRKVIAGGIVGVLCYFAINSSDIEAIYKSVIYAISGSLAPEAFDWARRKFIKTSK